MQNRLGHDEADMLKIDWWLLMGIFGTLYLFYGARNPKRRVNPQGLDHVGFFLKSAAFIFLAFTIARITWHFIV
jgi:hypothetical protein